MRPVHTIWLCVGRLVAKPNASAAPRGKQPAGKALSGKRRLYGSTRKGTLLESVPLGVTTSTFPVLAPSGTVVVIKYLDTTVNMAAVPLKVTLVAPVRLVPKILTAAPTSPEVVCVSTNGPRPTDSLKTVPSLLAPPADVVP